MPVSGTEIKRSNLLFHRIHDNELLRKVQHVIYKTIDICYPSIYSTAVIAFFKNHHLMENIQRKAYDGFTIAAMLKNEVIATGNLFENEVNSVYVLPEYQNQGLGKAIVRLLEEEAMRQGLKHLELHATPESKNLYLRCGFQVQEERNFEVEGGLLHYFQMYKEL